MGSRWQILAEARDPDLASGSPGIRVRHSSAYLANPRVRKCVLPDPVATIPDEPPPR